MQPAVDFPMLVTLKPYTCIDIEFDSHCGALYSWMRPKPRPCFNAAMLEEIKQSERLLEANHGHLNHLGEPHRVKYLVVASRTTGIFNLGGDLNMMVNAIRRNDRDLLDYYGRICVDNQLRRATGCGGLLTTIALVQGKAYGGGFECALACDVIVAEKSATFSFPEIQFNLFPGMGALSFLSRRVGMRIAEQMLTEPRIYCADELYDLGIVDQVVQDGEGIGSVSRLIARRERSGNSHRALQLAKRRLNPIDEAELRDIVGIWVDAALQLGERDLRLMSRLVAAQDRLMNTQAGDVDNAQAVAAVGCTH